MFKQCCHKVLQHWCYCFSIIAKCHNYGATTYTAIASAMTHLSVTSVAQLDVPSDWRPGGHGFNPRPGRQHSFMEIDHEIFSRVILSLPLIQEEQLSVSGETG